MNNTYFYNELPTYDDSVSEVLGQPAAFQSVPEDWHIVVTDIKNSTKTVEKGLSEIVNLIATGSIIAALNIASEASIDIPFFFGGDGATMLVPSILLEETMAALQAHQSNVRDEFDVDLRVGSFSVSELDHSKIDLKIAKVSVNILFSIPLVLGNGLHFAEDYIKANYTSIESKSKENVSLRLEGMQCRWNKVPPPNTTDEVICLLVDATEEFEQAIVFKSVLDKIHAIFGSHKKRHPLSIPKLKLNVSLDKMRSELRMKRSNHNFLELIMAKMMTSIGKFLYMPSRRGKKYLAKLVQLSDIFVLDGRINMVISGHADQRKQLEDFLEKEEQAGKLIYGMHLSKESIISCYVRNMDADHIHFVDGGAGGYTKAAKMLKVKIKNIKANSL